MRLFDDSFSELLVRLLGIDTVTPMETGRPSRLGEAQEIFVQHAEAIGMYRLLFAPPPASVLDFSACPLTVRETAKAMGTDFLSSQPSLVMAVGEGKPEQTIVFNTHMDTVSDHLPASFDGEVFRGRGAVDMKGPAVAVLAGVRHALAREPDLVGSMRILIHSVAGEEGGAMGVYGTKWILDQGFGGRLNVFAEPSAGVYFDRCTASMTLRISVQGEGATDDAPHAGHNATLLLGFLAQHLARRLGPVVHSMGCKMTVAGLETGHTHNRVFGTGRLLFNFAYGSDELGHEIRARTDAELNSGVAQFRAAFTDNPVSRRTVCDLDSILVRQWLKVGLPVLRNRDPIMERMLSELGVPRNPDERDDRTFTCDAIWTRSRDGYTIVCGPGGLESNGAHTPHEHVARADLEAFAVTVSALIRRFHTMLSPARQEVE